MRTAEFRKLKEARANYVRALRAYEDKHNVVIMSLHVHRQTITEDRNDEKQYRTIIAGIGEKEISRNDFLAKKRVEVKSIDAQPVESETLIVIDDYDG